MKRYFVAGGAGFIGSHVTRRLLERQETHVTVLDNLTSGTREHLGDALDSDRLELVVGDLQDAELTIRAMAGTDVAFHFAANPDIARAATEPAIDFWQGTLLAQNLLDGCRVNEVPLLIYASGSGVYGDRGEEEVHEEAGGMHPVSTYGASKLGCEATISAYCHMFGLAAVALRFANVVGPRQTHGVTYDFVRKLRQDPTRLEILGDGRQSKSYIVVDDVVDAMLMFADRHREGFEVYNVGTEDYMTVAEIAELVIERLGLEDVELVYSGGSRGWKGDVPIVRFNTEKARAAGWSNRLSTREALLASIDANIAETAGPGAR